MRKLKFLSPMDEYKLANFDAKAKMLADLQKARCRAKRSNEQVVNRSESSTEYKDDAINESKLRCEEKAKHDTETSELERENQRLVAENLAIKTLVDNANQQPALPVVPDFVDKFLKSKPIFNIVKYPIPIEIITWANKQTGYMDLEINITYLVKLKTNGYTVEKPQLFYLKHIDFCKTDKHYDWFTIKHSDGPLNHLRVEKRQKPSTIDCKFTQQEIDSMQTGSYEQIEVTE